ncbi:MAG: inositol monophosphatase family protein [Erysipelotrichaceae bacterium]
MQYIEKISPIIKKAGEIILGAKTINLEEKTNYQNLVTEFDKKVQAYLVKELKSIYPEYGFLNEEDTNNNELKEYNFIIDPIDGTTNFIHGLQFSAISIGIVQNQKVLAGLIYNPYNKELFTAELNHGAYLNNTPITISNRSFKEANIGFGASPYNREYLSKTYQLVEKCMETCRETRRFGTAALDLAYVACGRFDGFFEFHLFPWDFAAGLLLIKEAGGIITDFKGNDVDLYHPTTILAGNHNIHPQILSYLKAIL